VTDGEGRTLWAGAFCPGAHARPDRGADRGHRRPAHAVPQVKAKVDVGYCGLAREFPDQVQAPPLKPKKDATPEETAAWDDLRHRQSSERICVKPPLHRRDQRMAPTPLRKHALGCPPCALIQSQSSSPNGHLAYERPNSASGSVPERLTVRRLASPLAPETPAMPHPRRRSVIPDGDEAGTLAK
jgi:hypothetical protein